MMREHTMTQQQVVGSGRTEFPVPAVMRRSGTGGWIAAFVVGVILGGVALVVPVLLSPPVAFVVLAVLLGMIGSVYLGFALMDGRIALFGVEYVGLIIFFAVPVVALVNDLPVLLAAGYIGHALWDAFHHPGAVTTEMPRWYVPFCISFDIVIGVYVLLRFV